MSELPRKTRVAWDEAGHAHFLTYSCYRRLPLLTRERTRRWVVDAFAQVRASQAIDMWEYVIMPEHVHLHLCPQRAKYEMRVILAALKRPVSAAAKAHLTAAGEAAWLERLSVEKAGARVFRFWQPGGGFDRNVFRERSLPAIIEYIHANPVRRGLVAQPTDWEWSSARFWDGRRDVPIAMDDPYAR